MPTMVRETWTDERLGDLSKRMDKDFREVKTEIKSTRVELKEEIKSTRAELKEEIKSTRAELKGEISSSRTELKAEISELRGAIIHINQRLDNEFGRLSGRFDKLTYTLIAALIGLLLTHYLG